MKTPMPLYGDSENARSVALDTIALMLAAWRQDAHAVEAMLITYQQNPREMEQLACSLLANVVCILNASAHAGVNPEVLLSGAAMEIRNAA